MIAMATEDSMSKWRNFASWSAAGGLLVLVMAIAAIVAGSRSGDPLAAIVASGTDPRVVLALLLSMAVVGLSSLSKAFTWWRFRNFVIFSAATAVIAMLAIAGIRTLTNTGSYGTMDASRWAAAGTGLVLLSLGILISLVRAAARTGWTLVEAEQAETVRERRYLLSLSCFIFAAMGLTLMLLSLAGPHSAVSPLAALAGALLLCIVTAALTVAAWRAMDELDRTLSYETGNIAFYLTLLLGGGWALLAHLGFATAAAPLDWLTMLTAMSFVASFIAVGRRKLLVA